MPKLFCGRDKLTGGRDGAVLALHAEQAFVVHRFAGRGAHDGLEREKQAVVVQRGHDFVGDGHEA